MYLLYLLFLSPFKVLNPKSQVKMSWNKQMSDNDMCPYELQNFKQDAREIDTFLSGGVLNIHKVAKIFRSESIKAAEIDAIEDNRLDLSRNRLGNLHILDGVDLKKVIVLDLQDNFLDTYGIRNISTFLSTISCIYFGGNKIGNIGAKILSVALIGENSLKELHLERNAIGDIGAQALSDALKKNEYLDVLNLECNDIEEEGAKALEESIKSNETIKVINLKHNYLPLATVKGFELALKGRQ